MPNVMEAPETLEKGRKPDSPWIQITFTLDPEHYRTLWERAEGEHQTLPGFVRECVIGFLEIAKQCSSSEDRS